MNSKSVYEKFNELNKDNVLTCTQKDLDEFIMYGILFKTGKKYVTRNNQSLKLDLIKVKYLDFNLDFSNLITECTTLAKENKINKIFCMSSKSFNRYKEQGLIVTVEGKDYYRLFNKELWLVNLIN